MISFEIMMYWEAGEVKWCDVMGCLWCVGYMWEFLSQLSI